MPELPDITVYVEALEARIVGQPLERIAKDTNRDYYMSAGDAKEYGVVDEILERPQLSADDTDEEKE